MKINLATGIFEEIEFIASPFFNERPKDAEIDMLIVHCISLPPKEYGTNYPKDLFAGTLDVNAHPYFTMLPDVRVAPHVYIDRLGDITQFVPFHKRAWHAGVSSFQGRSDCNHYSIGIELEGDEETPYEQEQYVALAECTKSIQKRYPKITQERIVGHEDVSPGRKSDPGPSFDWDLFHNLLK